MTENNNDNKENQNHQETTQKDDSTRKLVDMLIRPSDQHKVVDSETLIKETQKRVWGALKKGYEYVGSIDESDKFLRQHVFSKIDMMVLYVDLVGSTVMMLELPEEKLAIIISSFAQEMAAVIKQFDGYVLKFVGDAAIGYFVVDESQLIVADNVVNCAKSMIAVIKKGINPILNQYDYPDLMVKIGIDFGKNIIVRYGANAEKSYVDLIGPPMNIAAKIQAFAKPDQILIGDDVYTRLHPSIQKSFEAVSWKNDEWNYRSRVTGKIYQVYEYKN